MTFPDHTKRNPIIFENGDRYPGTVFLDQAIDHENFHIGAYSYYADTTLTPDTDIAALLAPYTWPGAPENIHIGKFCQIAQGVQIITGRANHDMSGLTTFPFPIFDPAQIGSYRSSVARSRDVRIGHDVWIGRDALLMPAANIGNGVIVAARAVVTGDVPDYAMVAGNPAKVVKMRFDEATRARLLALAWWDWPAETIEAALPALQARDLDALESLQPS